MKELRESSSDNDKLRAINATILDTLDLPVRDKIHDEKRYGQAAYHLFENVAYKEAVWRLRTELLESIAKSAPPAYEDRERIYSYIGLLGGLQAQLQAMVNEVYMEQYKEVEEVI